MCNMVDFSISEKNRAVAFLTIFQVKQRQLPDQQVDSGP